MAANVVFALTPAKSINGLLDYSNDSHIKLYNKGTKPLSGELYDGEAEGLYQFLRDLKDRANEYGWTEGILLIDTNPQDPNANHQSFFENYGSITLQQLRESEEQYIDDQERQAQDTTMLYSCIMASLTREAKAKVNIWHEGYTIGNEKHSGVCLLKIIIREAHLDTNATVSSIRNKLSSLDTYGKFNQYVKLMVKSLRCRNKTASDLLNNLFKGYSAVPDEQFHSWYLRKLELYEEGTNMTPDDLMLSAKAKYDTLVEKGVWKAPSTNEKIIALETKMKESVKSLTKKISGGKKPTSTSPKKKSGGGDKKYDDHPKTWPKPSKGEPNKRSYKGRTWYYCHESTGGKCAGLWRAHSPKECKGTSFSTDHSKKHKSESKSGSKSDVNKRLKVARASVAKLEQEKNNATSGSDTEGTG